MKINIGIKEFLWTYKKPVIVVAVIILATVFVAFGFNPSKDYVTKMIGEFVKEQNALILENNKTQIETLQKEISVLRRQNTIRDQKIKELNKKMGDLENDISTNQEPTSLEELRDRFRKLRFVPIN